MKMRAATYAAKLQRLSAVLTREIVRAERESLDEAKAAAIALSSGAASIADLRRAGHPYSRRTPQEIFPAEIINRQSGKFVSAWRTTTPTVSAGTVVSRLFNNDPKATYMDGTARMVPRPIAAAVFARIQERRQTRLRAAFRDAVRKVFEQ